MDDIGAAQDLSNGIALVMLFACGFSMVRYSGGRPLVTALQLTGYGVALIAVTIVLGG